MHIPVLQKEVIKYLDPKPNENFIDATFGQGGHASAILDNNGPKGKVLGIDRDPEIIKYSETGSKRLILVCGNFINLQEIVKKYKFGPVQGILFDLGISSWHLEKSDRGFSFQRREPLDMRCNPDNPLTAEKIVNFWSKFEIEKILKEYGQESFAGSVAERIIGERKIRPIRNTFQLVEVIRKSLPARYLHQRLHFATRTFQALRIAVNDELNNLKKALPLAQDVLEPGGRLVIISFHSLEDRIVKNFFREMSSRMEILTKKPTRPSASEIQINPRARSAKLRAAKIL